MMPEACTILRELITMSNPGIGSRCNILQKSDKGEINHRRAAIPVLCLFFLRYPTTAMTLRINHDLLLH